MKYLSLRSYYRRKSRTRKEALPHTSLCFLLCIVLLPIIYSLFSDTEPPHTTTTSKIPSPLYPSVRASDYGNLCTREGHVFSRKSSLAFLIPGVIFCFIGLAIVTDDYFVSALEQICQRLNLSEDVAGATFMAAGSSTPEFFASLLSVFVTKDEVGIGTIVGSAVFNILIIIGVSAICAGAVLKLDWRPLMRDSFFYIISIALLLLFTVPSTKGRIDWWEALILIFTYGLYVLFMAFGNTPYMKWAAKFSNRRAATEADIEAADEDGLPTDDTITQPTLMANALQFSGATVSIGPDGKRRYRDLTPRTRLKVAQYAIIAARRLASTSSSEKTDSGLEGIPRQSNPQNSEDAEKEFLGVELPSDKLGWLIFPMSFPWRLFFRLTIVDCSQEGKGKWWLVTFITSILWISGISYVMVEAARISGCLLSIPATAMGLTVLAAGTSVPDALASISVARDGAGDMAVSNAIGSNVFDILLGLGVPWFLGSLILRTDGLSDILIPTDPITKVVVPVVILFVIMIVFLMILIALRWQMRPLLGYFLFGVYGLFVTYTLLDVFVLKWSVKD